jgi:hypothetical protein
MKLELSQLILREKRRYKNSWKSARVVAEFHADRRTTNGRTEKYDEANSRFSHFRERPLKPTHLLLDRENNRSLFWDAYKQHKCILWAEHWIFLKYKTVPTCSNRWAVRGQ